MITEQAKQMAEFFASHAERVSKPGLDLATKRDINEGLHVCGTEPEGVTYAEVDAGGVPAMWCIPQGSDTEHVLLHSHNGGAGGLPMHSDRKTARDIPQAPGDRPPGVGVLGSPGTQVPPPNRGAG